MASTHVLRGPALLPRADAWGHGAAAICGSWLLVTGQPVAVRRGRKIRLWKRVGLGLCLAIGVALGVAADAVLLFGRP